jgi:type III pantothenate kinase
MNLIIDIGNTAVKAALMEDGALVRSTRLASDDSDQITGFIGGNALHGAIVSSVVKDPLPLLSFLSGLTPRVHHLTFRSAFPFKIDYATPETLGVDRLAAAAGAYVHHPASDLLVIDAGSAMTVDLVSEGAFRGGSISPGLFMRFRALHEFTGRLPLVEKRDDFTFPGRTTVDAIAGGVVTGIVFEINEYIRTFEEKYRKLVTVITGGDGGLISSLSKRKMLHYPDLVAEGLNYLLETNV